MSIFRSNTVGSWTRGGQAIVHNMRMTMQVLFQTVVPALLLWTFCTVWYTLELSDGYDQYVVRKAIEASFKSSAVPNGGADQMLFKSREGRQYWTSPKAISASPIVRAASRRVERKFISGLLVAGLGTALVMAWTFYYFHMTGRGLGSNQFLRGAKLDTIRTLRLKLFWKAKGSFAIGGIAIPDAFEPEHIVISGAPGTGKTNIISGMLAGIRAKGKRAIVYDTAGTFVQQFYRPDRDIILNPLDERSSPWSPWVDVPKEYHYDQIAESTIPDKQGDPFWPKAARGTLVAVLRKLARMEHTLVSVLLDTILRSKTKDLARFAQGTDAAAFISAEGEKTSAGVQAELASVLKSFNYLDDTTDGFSIRQWVTQDTDDSWLFITTKSDQLPSLRPLITTWLDIAISAIMSMKPDRNRRIYVVADELPSLQRLPSMSDFLARARKYGGCAVLGFQSYPQLEGTYGIQDAAALTGYCSTWVALRANDSATAKHASENLGQVEQIEANEGLSYGVSDMRDGVNLSRLQVTRPLVLPTEIQNLPNLSGYLRFGRDLPVARFKDEYRSIPAAAEAFVERTRPPTRLPIGQAMLVRSGIITIDGEVIEPPTAKRALCSPPPLTTGNDEADVSAPTSALEAEKQPIRCAATTAEAEGAEEGAQATGGESGVGSGAQAEQVDESTIKPTSFVHLALMDDPKVELKAHGRAGDRRRRARPA